MVCTQLIVDTMLKDPQTPRYAARRTHRTYTAQFKAELIAACQEPGASIAALALQHAMNTNVLHRWLKEWQQGLHRRQACVSPQAAQHPAFIPIALGASPLSLSEQAPPAPSAPPANIRIECQRRGLSVTVHWPLSAANECAQLLEQLLR